MTTPPLACTVRDCGLVLEPRGRAWGCARGHTYDVARSGYVNLLQPHDRRSLASGDTREAVAARARLLERGIGRAIVDGVAAHAVPRVAAGDLVVDLGSGTGDALATLHGRTPIAGVGVDLSTAASEHAARRHPTLTWVVANADRRLPLLDSTVDAVLSLHGRRNPSECARVLRSGGWLLVAVPAPDDLIELRAAVLGQAVERDRAAAIETEHASAFDLVGRVELRERHAVDRDALRDLLRSTYRGERSSAARRFENLDHLDVTLASTVVVLQRRARR